MEKKNNLNIESQIKSYKFEYDQLVKNMCLLKKQHVLWFLNLIQETLTSKYETLDADYYNLKQEMNKNKTLSQKDMVKVQKEETTFVSKSSNNNINNLNNNLTVGGVAKA